LTNRLRPGKEADVTWQLNRLTLSTRLTLVLLACVFSAVVWMADDAHAEPPTWNVDSSVFGGEASVGGEGSNFVVDVPHLGLTITCNEIASGTIRSYDEAQFTETLTGCSTGEWDEVCSVAEPVSTEFQGDVGGPLTPTKPFVFELEGEECPFVEIPIDVSKLGFSFKFGSEEAARLPVTASAEGLIQLPGDGEWNATVSSSSTWRLTGAKNGHVWNFGSAGKPPADQWYVNGSTFIGEEYFSGEGSNFVVDVPHLGLTITCNEKASGTIRGYDEAQFTETLSGCSTGEWDEVCSVAKSVSTGFQGHVGGPLTPTKPVAFEFAGEECPFVEIPIDVSKLGFSFKFGSEAVKVPVTASAKGMIQLGAPPWTTEEEATVSSSSTWRLVGIKTGLPLGLH
jgi:hypothetical protein